MRKPSILIVEDEPPVLLTYRMILEQQGYNATPARTSVQATSLLAGQSVGELCRLGLALTWPLAVVALLAVGLLLGVLLRR